MAKFHIKKDGTPGKCSAKKGKCPLGGENEHFKTLYSAQLAADKLNEKTETVIIEKPKNTTVEKKSILEKHNSAKDILTAKRYEKNLRKVNERIGISIDSLEKDYEKLRKQAKKENKKFPKKEVYIKKLMETDPNLSMLINKRNSMQKEIIGLANKREISKDIENNSKDILVDISYSNASSSTYYVYERKDIDKVKEILSKSGIRIEENPNSTSEYIEVRISDHYPGEYLRSTEENKNVWDYTEGSILGFFPETETKKINNAETIAAIRKIEKL